VCGNFDTSWFCSDRQLRPRKVLQIIPSNVLPYSTLVEYDSYGY
jgi:hypothetical protein